MIKSLHIKNIALIDDAEINFCDNLNVLSGETGSGKTVIISSINFVLGGKADKSIIRFGKDFAEAEAVFSVENNNELKELLNDLNIEWDDDLVIFRKLSQDGKSTIKVNGQSVNSSMLKKISELICDIYGQSEHYSLLKESNQLKVLDCFIGEEIESLKSECGLLVKNIKELYDKLDSFGGSSRERENKLDLLKFQINEIESASLIEGEEESLLEKRKILLNSERIKEGIQFIHECFSVDNGIYDLVSQSQKRGSDLEKYSTKFLTLSDRLKALKIECQDISNESDDLLSSLDFNEEELKEIEDRLDIIRNLKRKYGDNIDEVSVYLDGCKKEFTNLVNYEEIFNKTNEEISSLKKKLTIIYDKITKVRTAYAEKFSREIESELNTLGMKNAKFHIELSRKNDDELISSGLDLAIFTFSANLGEPLKTMSKIISGGEMSRFMLAMKIVSNVLPNGSTYIFDEIDSGISGSVAEIVGEKFCKLSKNMQVLAISHLPQIVSFSDRSFLISKEEDGIKTTTNITELDEIGKQNELLRIIGSGDNEQTALSHVSEIIDKANRIKRTIRE